MLGQKINARCQLCFCNAKLPILFNIKGVTYYQNLHLICRASDYFCQRLDSAKQLSNDLITSFHGMNFNIY